MTDLILVRRTNGRFARKKASIKLEIIGNRFIINNQLADNLKLKHEDGVMFGFNYKEKKAYLFKDDEPDAFILRTKSVNDSNLRFTSKDLASHFINCFDLTLMESKYYFNVAETPNEKDAFLITCS
jgi:hypothetical protein